MIHAQTPAARVRRRSRPLANLRLIGLAALLAALWPATGFRQAVAGTIPEISCDKTVSVDGGLFLPSVEAAPGQRLTFRVTITNTGSARLDPVTLTDVVPPEFEDVSVVVGSTCDVTANTLFCSDLGPLDVGESTEVVYEARLSPAAPPTVLFNKASVVGQPSGGPPVGSQCIAEVRVLIPGIDCEFTVSIDGFLYEPIIEATPGQRVFFRIEVVNVGEAPLIDLSLRAPIPGEFTDVEVMSGSCSSSGSDVSCELAELAPGEAALFEYSAILQSHGGAMNIAVTIEAASGNPGNPGTPLFTTCTATVVPLEAFLACEKTVSRDGIQFEQEIKALPGDTLHYRVVVFNPGEAELFDVRIADFLPPDLENPRVENGSCFASGGLVECFIDRLSPGEIFELEYQADIIAEPKSAEIHNHVEIEAWSGTPGNPGYPAFEQCHAFVRIVRLTISPGDTTLVRTQELSLVFIVEGTTDVIWTRFEVDGKDVTAQILASGTPGTLAGDGVTLRVFEVPIPIVRRLGIGTHEMTAEALVDGETLTGRALWRCLHNTEP